MPLIFTSFNISKLQLSLLELWALLMNDQPVGLVEQNFGSGMKAIQKLIAIILS